MISVKLDTGFNIEVDFPISPFHLRLFAWLIDSVVMTAYTWGAIIALLRLVNNEWLGENLWVYVLVTLPVFLYHLVFEITWNGQSLGKRAMHTRVISLDGGQPTVSQFLIRWLFRTVDFPFWILPAIANRSLPWWCSIFVFSGIATLIISPRSQRIGDLVAGTILIDTRIYTSWQDTVFTELEAGYQPMFPEVMKLSDKDINTLKGIIERVKKTDDFDLSMKIAERIRSRLKISPGMDSLDFLETLLKDYNYYSNR